MPNAHGPKFIGQTIAGLFFMTLGVFLILYATLGFHQQKDWVLWAIGSSICINTGILFIISATVHKVKAELIKKQRSRRSEAPHRD